MIFGANGYTGRLAARYAKECNHRPVLAGRHGERIRRLAGELGFESRVFDLVDVAVAATNLEGVAAVLHCAGPFSTTSRPMLAACLRTGTHYLDISGESAHATRSICTAKPGTAPGARWQCAFARATPTP